MCLCCGPRKTEGPERRDSRRRFRSNQQDLPAAQAALVDAFRSLGEALPLPGDREDLRRQLSHGGLPLALGGFHLSRHQSGLGAHVRSRRRLGRGGQRGRCIPRWFSAVVCGLGFGYLIPDRVLDPPGRRPRRQIAPRSAGRAGSCWCWRSKRDRAWTPPFSTPAAACASLIRSWLRNSRSSIWS